MAKKTKTVKRFSKLEIVSKMVDDPFEKGRHIIVPCHANESSIERLLHKGLLQMDGYLATSRFRATYERASVGGASTIDYTKERVDGVAAGDIYTDAFVQAGRTLKSIMLELGRNYEMVALVAGQGMAIKAACDKCRCSYASGKERFEEGTSQLIDFYGLRSVGRGYKRGIVASHEVMTGPTHVDEAPKSVVDYSR